MSAAFAAASAFERREQQTLVRRRQRAETRLLRERKRNSRVAFAGFVVLAVALTFGIHSTFAPAAASVEAAPVDPMELEFAKTRVAHVLLTTVESAYCRELRFSNDNGRFSDAGRYRCFIDNQPTFNSGDPAPAADTSARADRFGSFFRTR